MWAEEAPDDSLRACDRAAALAEAEWHLPAGVLSAIGMVESGRSGLGSARPIAWPWSINAGGHGFYLPTKAAAIATVRALQAAGWQAIDVGCFQVDLYYHPEAFGTLDMSFDPNANAQAAARILAFSRFGGSSWDGAIALYHSASPTRGAQYLRQVQAAWPWVGARSASAIESGSASYVILLSDAARSVKVIAANDPCDCLAAGLPRVIGPQDSNAELQWTAIAPQMLPLVVSSSPDNARRLRTSRRLD